MGYIEVDGLKEFNRAVRRAEDRELPKRIGQANKTIGQLVISKLSPAPVPEAVGSGRGAAVRASATKREVLLRVGGGHRAHESMKVTKMRQWGARPVGGFGPKPDRPFIQGTVEKHRREIEAAYLEAIADAMRPAFHRTEP